MKPPTRLMIGLVLVALLYGVHVHLKTAKIFRNPTWDAQDEVGQFWSEFAFHYRFAKFFAEHPLSDWGRLANDGEVQYPDTINDWAEFTVAMEVPVGVLYRWLNPAVPFHVWVVWYDCLVSSLSLFAIFFLARALWRSDAAGVMASVLYASLYPSYGRTVKNLFLREDFAIPLIIFALFFTVRAVQAASGTGVSPVSSITKNGRDARSTMWQVLAGLVWLLALASWHLTQFVLAVAVGAAVLVYLGKGETPRIPWFVVLLGAGAVLIPVLRVKQFYLSPTMCVLYALALAVWINGGRKRAIKIFAGSLVALVAVSLLLRQSYGEYAHVYQLFFYKLRFLGVKPEDPVRLPWEARCLWEGAFNTADWREFWHSLQWCGPLAIVAVWMDGRVEGWKDGRVAEGKVALQIFAVFTLALVFLSWMVVRYFTFLGFAVAVLAAGLVTRRIWWKLAVVGVALWQLVALDLLPLDRTPVVPGNYKPVVQWLNTHTPTNAVVLATISESPSFWAYTGRPIILHSKFENREIRNRYREFLEAIYGPEWVFYAFARRFGADYVVFDIGFLLTGRDSRRYKADRLGDLAPDSTVMLFAAQPQRLQHFEPQYVDNQFAVFRVLR